jgi:hypothetical protein
VKHYPFYDVFNNIEIFLHQNHIYILIQKYYHLRKVGTAYMVTTRLISGVSAINPLVDFYDIHGRKREVLFLYFVRLIIIKTYMLWILDNG